MNTLFIIIALLLLGGGVAIYKFKFTSKPKKADKKIPVKKRGATVKQVKPTNVDGIPEDMLDDPFFEKNPERDPLVKLAKEADKKPARKPRRKKRAKK